MRFKDTINPKILTNGTIDIMKLIMSILVVGIHTEPFASNIWLDRGFGIVTRLCVPFFFVTSAYFYWSKEKSPLQYLKRILLLYIVWSIIYLPFDVNVLANMTIPEILCRYLWNGNTHGLWYLCGSVIGFIIIYFLLIFFEPKTVFKISVAFLLVGCLKSTYSPLVERLCNIEMLKWLGGESRNGLFYAFPYMALGMLIAKNPYKIPKYSIKQLLFRFIMSCVALCVECVIFVVGFNSSSAVLWISVLPCTYYFFLLCMNVNIQIDKSLSVKIRKMSTLIYVSNYFFIQILREFMNPVLLFFVVTAVTVIFALLVIELSEKKYFSLLKFLY